MIFGTSANADWRILSVELSKGATIVRSTANGAALLFKVPLGQAIDPAAMMRQTASGSAPRSATLWRAR